MVCYSYLGLSAALLLTVPALAGCSDKGDERDAGAHAGPTKVNGLTPEQAAHALVKIGGTTITVGEFAERLADQSPYLRARYNSPERRREFLDTMIRFELLAGEASRLRYDKAPDVDRTRKQMMIQQMMKEMFEDRIKVSDITDAEIQQYYDAHPEEFNKPEQVRASHILVRHHETAERVLQTVLARPDDGGVFREQAERFNEDAATKERFGDLGFFARPGQGVPEENATLVLAPVAEAVFSIQQLGGIKAELVQADDGFHIVKLTARRAALRRTLEEARRPIQNRLWREKRDKAVSDFVDGLRAQAHVEENWDALADLHLDIPEGDVAPPDMPGPGEMPPGMMRGAGPGPGGLPAAGPGGRESRSLRGATTPALAPRPVPQRGLAPASSRRAPAAGHGPTAPAP